MKPVEEKGLSKKVPTATSRPPIAVVAVSSKSLAQSVERKLSQTGMQSVKLDPSSKLFAMLNASTKWNGRVLNEGT